MIEELLRARRSVRRFKEAPVPRAVVERLLDAAILAPSASNRQPWRFVVVERRETIAAMTAAVRGAVETLVSTVVEDERAAVLSYASAFSAFASAPTLLVPLFRSPSTLTNLLGGEVDHGLRLRVATMERDSALVSASLALGNLILLAHELGLGATIMTGPLVAAAELEGFLAIPTGQSMLAVVPIGYPDETPEATPRTPASRVTRWIA